jgi:hypothetical protein
MLDFIRWAWCVLFHPPLVVRRKGNAIWIECPKCGSPYGWKQVVPKEVEDAADTAGA